MDTLPDELIEMILMKLPPKDVFTCLNTAKLFHVIPREYLLKLKYSTMRGHTYIVYDDAKGLEYSIEVLERIEFLSEYLLKCAIKNDKPLIATYLLHKLKRTDMIDRYIEYAFKHSATRCITLWCSSTGVEISGDYSVPYVASFDGSLECMRYLLFMGVTHGTSVPANDVFPEEAANATIKTCDLSKIRFMLSIGCQHTTNGWAFRVGNIHTVKYLVEKKQIKEPAMCLSIAASLGHTTITKLTYIYMIMENIRDANGHYNAVQGYAFGNAASERSLETVRFLHFIGTATPVSKSGVLNFAIKRGELDITRWLFLLGYDYNVSSFAIAAQWCTVKFIQYGFRKMGLPTNYDHVFLGHGSIFARATAFNNYMLAEWLLNKDAVR